MLPAHLSDTLRPLVEQLDDEARHCGLTRRRGGIARGVEWAELAGRADDDTFYELRLHHRPIEARVQAGLLGYLPLTRGGRTIVVGETSVTYGSSADEVTGDVLTSVRSWLAQLARYVERSSP
jgi:hypothetical protein